MKLKTKPAADGTAAAMNMYAAPKAAKSGPARVSKIATSIAFTALLAGLACACATAILVFQNWSWLDKF